MKELASLLPLVGIFLIFWLLVIRPGESPQQGAGARCSPTCGWATG